MTDRADILNPSDGPSACSQEAEAICRPSTEKFKDPTITALGEPRATVRLRRLKTLWFNTGTLCNITCQNCYIESSPRNDRLLYLTREEVRSYLEEIERDDWGTEEIGFTGGEPFMSPDIFGMLDDSLSRGFRVTVLTNAMRPMQRSKSKLLRLNAKFGDALVLRVSLDHYTPARHDEERGLRAFRSALEGLAWAAQNAFRTTVAGRTVWGESQDNARAGYARLFARHAIPIDATDPAQLVLFPEMHAGTDVPEITTRCWKILGKSPSDIMCSSSRMVVRRKGSQRTAVVSCTLLPYDTQFELGHTLKDAAKSVALNHRYCAQFCVLGGASCSTI